MEKNAVEKNSLKVYNEDNLAKSNVLIQSKYKTTALGNKIIALGLYHIQKEDYTISQNGGNLVCELPASEIRQRLGRSGNSLYRDLAETADKLSTYQLGYKDPERQEFRYINLFTEMAYEGGVFSITFNGDLKMYLSELKDNYTILNLPLMLKWQKAYTFRLFEILSSRTYLYKDLGYNCESKYGLAEFKFTIGYYDIDDEKVRPHIKGKKAPDYDLAEAEMLESRKQGKDEKKITMKWGEFKRSIIDPAVEEINSTEEADMLIDEVIPLKKGRGGKVYGIVFKYRTHLDAQDASDIVDAEAAATVEPAENQLTEDEKFDFEATVKSDILSRHKLPIADIRAICSAANYDMDKIKRASSLLNQQHGDIDNVVGWLIASIKKSYTAKSKKGKKNEFNEFEQHEYSQMELDDLEAALLKSNK